MVEKIKSKTLKLDLLKRMNNVIFHRGPDQDGTFLEYLDSISIGMTMRRLSIIDISKPDKYLINSWDKKHILKEAFKGYFPKGFLDKSKKGFGVPVGDWLRGGLKNELLSYIEKPYLEDQAIFN